MHNWYSSESWEYNSEWDDDVLSYKSIKKKTSTSAAVWQDSDMMKHDEDMSWIECTERDCSIHYRQKLKAWWFSTESEIYIKKNRYHWHDREQETDIWVCYWLRCAVSLYQEMKTEKYKTMSRACRKVFDQES